MIDVDSLITAYKQGFFPMADEITRKIYFYSPEKRAVFPIDKIKPKKSVVKFLKQQPMKTTINYDFRYVITECSNRETTWISQEIIDWYRKLHSAGYAHSVEVWQNDSIVGGLYGVAIGGAFFGESMFNLIPNASKVAFYFLVEHLRKKDFFLLDSQFINDFTKQLGAIEIPRGEYLALLNYATKLKKSFV